MVRLATVAISFLAAFTGCRSQVELPNGPGSTDWSCTGEEQVADTVRTWSATVMDSRRGTVLGVVMVYWTFSRRPGGASGEKVCIATAAVPDFLGLTAELDREVNYERATTAFKLNIHVGIVTPTVIESDGTRRTPARASIRWIVGSDGEGEFDYVTSWGTGGALTFPWNDLVLSYAAGVSDPP